MNREVRVLGEKMSWADSADPEVDLISKVASLHPGLRNRLMDEQCLIEMVLRNRAIQIILQRLPELGLPDAWLASGSVMQTVWNVLTGRAPDYGIKDYDILYFDDDTSWEAEDAIIQRVAAAVSDISVSVELRNQARVHLWYPSKFGIAYPPLQRATQGIDRFLALARKSESGQRKETMISMHRMVLTIFRR